MTLLIRRIENSLDSKGRNTTLLTTVLHMSLSSSYVSDIFDKIISEVETMETDEITYKSDFNNEVECTGLVVLKLLNQIQEDHPTLNILKEEWQEDSINSNGKPFKVEDQIYNVEVF